ncbi:hypothetical protein Q6264_30245, partial [Klebsiella pneumoniae]|uniref:hypothetical protein n=1 Tax=Klebsiella pneumoniae TaxID=573 RepID=UPI002731A625
IIRRPAQPPRRRAVALGAAGREETAVGSRIFRVSGFECVWSVCLQRSSGGAKPDFVVARQSTFDYDETGF